MPPAKKSETKPTAEAAAPPDTTANADASYSGQAAKLAADAQRLVDQTRDRLEGLMHGVQHVQQTAPTVTEAAVADGVRRIPMAVGEVRRAVDGLQAAAAELAQRAAG